MTGNFFGVKVCREYRVKFFMGACVSAGKKVDKARIMFGIRVKGGVAFGKEKAGSEAIAGKSCIIRF